jgi:hypothetical protein
LENDQDDFSLDAFYHRRGENSKVPWVIGAGLLVVLMGTFYLYQHVEQRGISIRGEGHIAVLPNGDTWLFFLNGALVKATPESAKRFNAKPGPCSNIDGSMKGELPIFQIDELECTPGASIVPRLTARMQEMGLAFGYWPKELEYSGQSLVDVSNTLEIVLSMMDERATEPQLVPLYDPLFPLTVRSARAHAPPPLIINVERNDLVTNRFGRDELESFLEQPAFVLAGAAQKGGWLVRSLQVTPGGAEWLERLLIAPTEEPWPKLLRDPIVHVARRNAGPHPHAARTE